jgi:serine/threonine protein kinase
MFHIILEIILQLAEGHVLKITDVGATRVTQMLCGSLAYMAPEVLLSRKIQTNKIDIYSFSLIFWEMWFGKDVADEINKGLLGYGFHGNAMELLKSQIARTYGWRPPLSSPKRPPKMLTGVLNRGWASDPEDRPSANEFGNTLKLFLKNNL